MVKELYQIHSCKKYDGTSQRTPVLVLVIICLGGQFGINCPSAFLKVLKLSEFAWKLVSLTVGNYKSVSRQLQNKTVNGAMSITINCVISVQTE